MKVRSRVVGITALLLIPVLSACSTTHPIGDQSILYPNQGVRGTSSQICFYSVEEIDVRAPEGQRLTVAIGDQRPGTDRVRQAFAQSFTGSDQWIRGVQSDSRNNNPDIRTNPRKVVGVSIYDEDARLVGFNTIDQMPAACGGATGKKIMFDARIFVQYAYGVARVTAKSDRKY